MTEPGYGRGAAAMLVATLMFAAMGATIKTAAQTLPNEMVVFLRNVFGLLVLVPVLYHVGFHSLRTQRLPLHVFRTLAGLASMYCFFYALGRLHLAEAVLLNFTTPLFSPLIALLWLGEPLPARLRLAMVVGFVGVALVLKPGVGILSGTGVIGLAAGLFAAVAMVVIRRMADTEPPTRIVFYYGVICTTVSAVPLTWAWRTPDAGELLVMLLAGTFATVGQLFLTKAYALAPAARVGPFTYATVIFSALFGWWWWDEIPDALAAAGALLVMAGGALALSRGRASKRMASS